MKALLQKKYGSTNQLWVGETAKPIPKEHEVLVKIVASAVNDYDWSMVSGKPYLYRLMFGLFKPKYPIMGMELAGVVEEVGPKASLFQPSDEVYGDTSEFTFGTHAEYISVNELALVKKPTKMPFTHAAAISHASMLAYQTLFDYGKLKNDQEILINGAGGGVGTFSYQIAKPFQAKIDGVDTGKKLKKLKEMGFRNVFDYKEVNFTKNKLQYDLIIDTKTNRSPFSYLRSLKKNGKYITVGGKLSKLLLLVICKPFIKLFTGKIVQILALKPNKDLQQINELYELGKIQCIIDGPFPLNEAPSAIQYFGDGKHTGKVVIEI